MTMFLEEVDMTEDIQRESKVKDGSDVDWTPSNKMDYCYTGFLDYKTSDILKDVDLIEYND